MKDVKKIFSKELLKYGFQRKKDWYFKNNEITIVINIQKSNYSDTYFLNVGIWINQISTEFEFPKEHNCHLKFRAESLFPNIPNDLNPLNILDFEEKNYARLEKVEKFLNEYFCPFLENFKEINLICKMYKKGVFSDALIRKEVKEICQ